MSLTTSLSIITTVVSNSSGQQPVEPFASPDTDLEQYADDKGPAAIVLMQEQIDAVQENADPDIDAPMCVPMDSPMLDLAPITDLVNGTLILDSLPQMPDIQLEIPAIAADAINVATEIYAEISGALNAALPLLSAMPAMINNLANMPSMIMGQVGAQIGAQIGGALDQVGLLNPIMFGAKLGVQAMQVHSALSMLKNGNISSPAMMGALGGSLQLATSVVPSLGPTGASIMNASAGVLGTINSVSNAALSAASSVSAIQAAVSNPSTMTPSIIANATSHAAYSVQSALSTISSQVQG